MNFFPTRSSRQSRSSRQHRIGSQRGAIAPAAHDATPPSEGRKRRARISVLARGALKKALGIDQQTGVKPLRDLRPVGSHFHHYYVPEGILDSNSVCYCIGAGEDISFDTELKTRYGCNVHIFDPTPYGIDHFNELKDHVSNGRTLTLNEGGRSYIYRITRDQLSGIEYVPIGVWREKTLLTLRDSGKQTYPSFSAYFFPESEATLEAPVDRLGNLMRERGHRSVDVVKIEIEGAEYAVLDTIVEDRLDIKVILVVFDEVFNAKGIARFFRIRRYSRKLIKAGYTLVYSNRCFKRTFVRNDVYRRLKSLEVERRRRARMR
ncbi:MAG TPA: FkbM family methyltransferase [Rhodanobacteraceae bacterium]|nr:FkbM family methyltransferase [Rhodanobacteraceae bacterium]